jgi:Sec-independent protein translocase protein TatA
VALLLVAAACVVGTIPASAQRENRSIGENGREARKAAKQQQKASGKMAKKQRKAAKKYQKQQRKLQNHRTR